MSSLANNRNGGLLITRNEHSMPKWVTEQSDRIGPRPPPPPLTPENGHAAPKQPSLPPKTKTQPEPDYEVIEFSNQQYSNAPLRPNSANSGSKTPDNKLKCTLCGSGNPWVTCEQCSQQIFCASCDDMFHKHPKRKDHQRKTLEKSRPPLPPKVLPGQPGPTPPVAPPRRNKRGLMTPLMQRKDQGNASYPPVPQSPTPSMKQSSWQERFGSLPRGLNLLNRPLPETPKTPSESSRSTTPKSVFDNIQRPPSVALEKIKTKANATLDRMQLLQQRYRQQKEQMERERSDSVTDQRQMALQHHQTAAQKANQLGQRAMSSSVFNLNQINRKQPVANNGWANNPLQQAQSMAQLNCANCAQHQNQWNGAQQHHMHMPQDPWSNQLSSQQHFNRSNMSLNIPAGYMMQPQMNGMYPPPSFMNQRGLMQQMYPQPYMGGMPVMNPGLMGMPPSTSRAASRAGSRMASPAMSRKSVTLRRKQHSNYIDDEATDDEDSDEYDRRSITSTRSGISRSRQRRLSSASQLQLDDNEDINQAKLHRNRTRNQRRDSIAKSVHNDWAPGKRTSSNNNNRSADSGFNSPLKPSRIYSDLDSEGSGTRALVQAKIEQKLKEESLKQTKQTKAKRQSQSPPPQKTSAAVQTPSVKQTVKAESAKEKVKEEPKPSVKEKDTESEEETESEGEVEQKNEKKVIKEEEDKEEESSEAEKTEESEEESEAEEETEQVKENEIEEDDLGPPPSTPDHEWECEFCTFVNEPNIKICTICCKTPSIKPKKALKAISPPRQIKANANKKEKETKDKEKSMEKDKSGTIKKKPLTSKETQASSIQNSLETNKETEKVNTNHIQTTKQGSAHNTNEGLESSNNNTLKKKESVEDIWAALDENIQATAHEITRKAETKNITKVSTACGTSSKSSSIERQARTSSQAREIGTSPPPQSISTQTYDTLPVQKSEAKNELNNKTSTQPNLFNDMIQTNTFPSSPKIQDLKSFEAEVLNKIHNISHIPSPQHHQYNQYQHHHSHGPHSMYSFNERQRYRSNNDLRMDDTMSSMDFDSYNGLGRRQPSISELMLLQKTSSQMHSPLGGSIYDLPYRELSSLRLNDMENHKESDIYKHTTEELNAALKYCGPDMHPLVWLRDNWPKLIQTVQSLATKYGQERAENTIGTISQMEAREALRLHTGNIWQAVSECIEQRQRKYREISSKGNFSREDIVTALTTHQGNLELALMDLNRSQLKPFLMRIWGSPGGVENESGSQPAPQTLSQNYNIDKDIHNFLSANASECMQTPNATGGAFLNNNQLPSPFDRPLNSPSYENHNNNNNHMLDNTSSYSADSKDFINSPLPLDDSILSNKNVLKDLETLIGNMEHNQQQHQTSSNEQVLRSLHDMISNTNTKPENDYDSETMRILTKSPINSPRFKSSTKDHNTENEADVKNFVWQHIQEIVPNLVQQVEMELMEDIEDKLENKEEVEVDEGRREILTETEPKVAPLPAPPPPPPIDQDEFLMEEVIKPNIKNASIREELPTQYVYTAEIATFQLAFDKGLEREHEEEFEFETLKEASRIVYKMFKAAKAPEAPEIQSLIKESVQSKEAFGGARNADQTSIQESAPLANQSEALNNVTQSRSPREQSLHSQETDGDIINAEQTPIQRSAPLGIQSEALNKATNKVTQSPPSREKTVQSKVTTGDVGNTKESLVQGAVSPGAQTEPLNESIQNANITNISGALSETSPANSDIPNSSGNTNLAENSTETPSEVFTTNYESFKTVKEVIEKDIHLQIASSSNETASELLAKDKEIPSASQIQITASSSYQSALPAERINEIENSSEPITSKETQNETQRDSVRTMEIPTASQTVTSELINNSRAASIEALTDQLKTIVEIPQLPQEPKTSSEDIKAPSPLQTAESTAEEDKNVLISSSDATPTNNNKIPLAVSSKNDSNTPTPQAPTSQPPTAKKESGKLSKSKEKHENANASNRRRKSKQVSKIQTNNLNLYKKTTLKDLSNDLEQAEAEIAMARSVSQDQTKDTVLKESTNVVATTVSNVFQDSENVQQSTALTEAEPVTDNEQERKLENLTENIIAQSKLESDTIIQKVNSSSDLLQLTKEANENKTIDLFQPKEVTSRISQSSLEPNETVSLNETKASTTETQNSSTNKKISKIPVRRTSSNKSLIISNNIPTKMEINETKETELSEQNPPQTNQIKIPPSSNEIENINNSLTEEESEEEELYSIESGTSTTDVASRADQLQSSSTTNEMFLVIQQEGGTETNSTIAPSTSSSTLHSIISQSSGLKSPTEFIPSGDPSKQNLSELVEDTQRLIKQMRDEISIDDFESSTDDDYTDEYSDDYDEEEEEGEEEEEEDEDWEEEEEDEDDGDYDDITEEETENVTEDITDETEGYSEEVDLINKSQLSNLSQQESQDQRELHNSSILSNIIETSDHSQAFLSDHLEQEESMITESNSTQNQNKSSEATLNAFVETENSLPEMTVESVTVESVEKSPVSMQFLETENRLSELPVETVLTSVHNPTQDQSITSTQDHFNKTPDSENITPLVSGVRETITVAQDHSINTQDSEDKMALVSGLKDILSASISINHELETENSLPEMPAEVVVADVATEHSTNIKDSSITKPSKDIQESEAELPMENELPVTSKSIQETKLPESSAIKTEDIPTLKNAIPRASEAADSSSTSQNKNSVNASKTEVLSTFSSATPKTSEADSSSTSQDTNSVNTSKVDSLISQDDLPSTSNANKMSAIPQRKPLEDSNKSQPKAFEINDDNIPSTSKGISTSETKKKSKEEIKSPVKKPLAASKIPKPKEMPKESKPKENSTTTSKPHNEFKKKLYTRSKSFSGPPTPIGIASVKTISQKFISPTQNTTQPITPKKLPTVTRKSSIVEVINKFTKPSSSTEKPLVSALFKSRTQPRIPKKKYHETCFSDDDYESSSSEEEMEPLEIRLRKLSVPVFRAYPSVKEPEEVNPEELMQKFMKEELVTTIAEAQIAAALVSMKFQQDVSLWAAKECSDLDHAIALLKQECELCSGTYALNQIVSMLKCTHKCCKQCAKTYFTVQITERSINDCSCPFCKLPELHNQTEHEDENLEYFSNLDIFLKNILEPEVHELFQRKLRDRSLLKDPNFKWCVQCSSGFFARPKQKRLICPDCGSVTCAQCRKTWQKQHEGISCDQFSQWEAANDPEVQAKGVQQHLEQNGIDCPKCKFRYSLARGGCMHFTCTQCKYEFCYGCAKPFMMGAKCNISPYCAKLGLHAHHPRNCLFYLRDKLPVQLQILLKNNAVSFEVDPIEPQENNIDDNEPGTSKKKELFCPIPIQKETPTGLVDTRCNGEVPEKHAGMCRTHYVEYLTAKVAKAKIDPLPIFDLTDCVQELRRRGIALPERGPWDTDEIYKTMCAEVIQKNIPLDMA